MKLVSVLACRNESSRLYAKPLQNLDVKNGVTILDYMLRQMEFHPVIAERVLAISEQKENEIYKTVSEKHKIPYVTGSDKDVLFRLINGGDLAGADNILRVTSESPYPCFEDLEDVYEAHCKNDIDCSVISGLPDGSFYEIIKLDALKKSWDLGSEKHRSELCTLYIFENQDKFKISRHKCRKEYARLDIRLTVDWPEDLIVMREIYEGVGLSPDKLLEFSGIIEFLDKNPKINAINNWIDSGIGRVWY